MPGETALAPPLQQEVERAVAGVLDPCSRFNGTWLTFGELGMVDAVRIDEAGGVHVRMLLDDPTCTYSYDIHREIKAAAGGVAGVRDVAVEIRGDAIWTEDLATEAARAKMEAWRVQRLAQMAALRCATQSGGHGACQACPSSKETA